MGVELERISAANVAVFKAVRLRALRDTPTAFGSTYAREAAFDDAEWLRRAVRMSRESSPSEIGAGYLAMDAGAACGIVGVFLDEHDSAHAHIVSMWVAPERRKAGVGRMLIDACRRWAAARGVRTLTLMVTNVNQGALEFYLRNGFSLSGKTSPYPNDPAIFEYEMTQTIQAR